MVPKSKTNKIKKFTDVATNARRVGIFPIYKANLTLEMVAAENLQYAVNNV